MPIDPGFGAFGRRLGLQPLTTPENWNNCLNLTLLDAKNIMFNSFIQMGGSLQHLTTPEILGNWSDFRFPCQGSEICPPDTICVIFLLINLSSCSGSPLISSTLTHLDLHQCVSKYVLSFLLCDLFQIYIGIIDI